MQYPTIEDTIIDDGRISDWLAKQIIETRDIDTSIAIRGVNKLKVILDNRTDRLIKERKSFKTQLDMKTIDF